MADYLPTTDSMSTVFAPHDTYGVVSLSQPSSIVLLFLFLQHSTLAILATLATLPPSFTLPFPLHRMTPAACRDRMH